MRHAEGDKLVTNDTEIKLSSFAEWRTQLRDSVVSLREFMDNNEISDLRLNHQIETVLAALKEDKFNIMFLGDFAHGKSELINAILFHETDERILPSDSGHTTKCATELRYDSDQKPSIRLLPIEFRNSRKPLEELKQYPSIWQEIEFDKSDPNSIQSALSATTLSRLVSRKYASELQFNLATKDNSKLGLHVNEYDEVEIPKWRHAIVNIPHPLLDLGYVILDTPGLDILSADPEFTYTQTSAAHAIIYVLSQNTGVAETDLELWENHLRFQNQVTNKKTSDLNIVRQNLRNNQKRVIALNKIDTLWDGIRNSQEIETEIINQVANTAKTLDINQKSIIPVSAQKALQGRVEANPELIKHSRIQILESEITRRAVVQKQTTIIEQIREPIDAVIQITNSLLRDRQQDNELHISELQQLSTKNTDVISHIMAKASSEKTSLEEDMKHYQALRSVYNKETQRLLRALSNERLERLIIRTKREMARCVTSLALPKIINGFFARIQQYFQEATDYAEAAASLAETATKDLEYQHGISDYQVPRLNLDRFEQEFIDLEHEYQDLKKTKTLLLKEQSSITNKFYLGACASARDIFQIAVDEATTWTNNLIVPMETRMRDHHAQLRQRVESVKRIYEASDGIESRLNELNDIQGTTKNQLSRFTTLKNEINRLLIMAYERPEVKQHQTHTKGSNTSKVLNIEHSANP